MTTTRIWLSSPHMGGTEMMYIKDAFDTNWVAPLGHNVDQFEQAIASYVGQGVNTAALSSGTAALHLALELLGVSDGDVVICQSFTFAASANPILYLNAEPVFVDSEKETWNISPELLEIAIEASLSRGKKPKAIIAVHLYGMPYQVGAITEIATKYDIPVVEDSAEALGSTYFGQKCGSFGAIAALSFNGNKIITTSGGGALLTKNLEVRQKAIHLATQARDNAPHYQHSKVGYNYRMSNILAGIGRGQMEVLDDRVHARRANFNYYRERLGSYVEFEFLEEPDGFFSNRWLTCVLTPSFAFREKIRLALLEADIESRPLWKPMHLQPLFDKYEQFTDGTSEDLFNRGLCFPSGSNLQEQDLDRIVSLILNNINQ